MTTRKPNPDNEPEPIVGEVVGSAGLAPEQPTTFALVPLNDIRANIDALLDARRYLLDKVLPLMVAKVDYNEIKGRKSLGKPGAEKIAAIWRYNASFQVDRDTLACLGGEGGVLAYVCTLTRNGEFVGEGRGARTIKQDGGDINKAVKMAQKSAYVDAVIRATGISDLFTQDLEDMHGGSDDDDAEPARSMCPKCKTHEVWPSQFNEGQHYCNAKRGGCGWQGVLNAEHPEPQSAATPEADERVQRARQTFAQATGKAPAAETPKPAPAPQAVAAEPQESAAKVAASKKQYATYIATASKLAAQAAEKAQALAKSDATLAAEYQSIADGLAENVTRALDATKVSPPLNWAQYERGCKWLGDVLKTAGDAMVVAESKELPFN